MKLRSSLRSLMLLTTAVTGLAACSGGGGNANNGSTGSVVIGGGNTGGTTTADISFIPAGFTCPTGTSQGIFTSGTVDIEGCIISGDILSDLTLPGSAGLGSRPGYILDGSVFVGENVIDDAAGATATLTVGAGAILLGQSGEDALFINPGSQIVADGTAAAPIVMTSASDAADGSVDDGLVSGSSTAKGEWGGLVISGLAKINDCDDATATPGTVDCVKTGEGGSGVFGGDDDTDNSGILNYVRVQYAGFRFNGSDELNGIAFQGVGSGTSVSYVQVHNGNDDGVEFFGGDVNADHIVVTGADDDSIDWTDGWRGELQFALVAQDDVSADRGIEGDNRGGDINVGDAEGLRSNPQISNLTFIGSSASAASPGDGIKLRAGTNANVANAIVTGFALDGLDYDDSEDGVVSGATPSVNSIFVAENGTPFDGDGEVIFNAGSNNTSGAFTTLDGVVGGSAEQAVAATDISAGTDTLASTSFIGAFDPSSETNDSNWTSNWTLSSSIPGATPPACPVGTSLSSDAVPAGRVESLICLVPNEILVDTTLTNGNLYKFAGTVFVGEDAGPTAASPVTGAAQVTLTIQPGVTVMGETSEDALVVNRGSRIVADGSADAPIVFTAEADIRQGEGGFPTLAGTEKGLFGGLVLNGRARINDCNVGTNVPGTDGCVKTGEGGSGDFGGDLDSDDSGVLSYVQVRYAGFRFNGSDELNGIAFQGVGDGTTVDHIQVHNGNDDGVEFYGGTVDADYVIITNTDDDSIDWTDGWRGSVQYALVVQDDVSADRGIEGDNRGGDVNVGDAQGVRSAPTISNFTFFGSSAAAASPGDGVKLREGTDALLLNGIVLGFGAADGIDYDASNDGVASTATPELFSIYVADNGSATDSDGGAIFTTANGNVDGGADRNMDGFLPNATLQAAITATDVTTVTFPTNADNSADVEATTFVGAFDPVNETNDDNWTTGWSFNVNPALPNVAN